MLVKTITYTDYNGVERTEDFYFNLSKAEVMEMELAEEGGLKQMLEKAVKEQDIPKLAQVFKDLIMTSYGEKSPDGKRFVKSEELSLAFSQTEAYSELLVELFEADKMSHFVENVLPSDLEKTVTRLEQTYTQKQ